jgi:hypothetical protein
MFMSRKCHSWCVVLILTVIAMPSTLVSSAWACGGFFCQAVPIVQAGEQVIFRQDGNMVTAVVLIQYAGEAQDFSWVVPVPGIPELSTGSDVVFSSLEQITRPVFNLTTTGNPCSFCGFGACAADSAGGGEEFPAEGSNDNEDGGVTILEMITVGPFDVQVVASEDPDALAIWLDENDYDLTDRGRELVVPYVEEGKNFVALKLRQNAGVGDIQPLIMRYEYEVPCIPIRLTAVAAQPDMGVLVWLLGSSRAIPINYLHVTPNYTRLNWYSGSFNAYLSYQTLITDAMNEAGGQAFATDYAGRDVNIVDQIVSPDTYSSELVNVSGISDDAEFVSATANSFIFPNDQILEILRRALPVGDVSQEFTYSVPELLRATFSAEQLETARQQIVVEINDALIEPLRETLALFDGDPYLTRFYTTLSAEEMTLDPTFSFNPDLSDQSLERNAILDTTCGRGWSLTLGEGTGREGEKVIQGTGDPPFFTVVPTIAQDASWKMEMLPTSGPPLVIEQKQFPLAQIVDEAGSGGSIDTACGNAAPTLCGNGVALAMIVGMLGLRLMRKR